MNTLYHHGKNKVKFKRTRVMKLFVVDLKILKGRNKLIYYLLIEIFHVS